MVSEKPPRHSKSKGEPVTIDLDPKDVKRTAEEPTMPEPRTDKPQTAAPQSDSKNSDVKPDNTAPASTASDGANTEAKKAETVGAAQWSKGPDVKFAPSSSANATANKPTPEALQTSAKPSASATSSASSSASGTTGSASSKSSQAAKPNPSQSYTTPPQATVKGTSNSGAIAAGIFGGLIALFAAGSLQYAGYIPGMAPSNSNDELSSLRNDIEALKQTVVQQQTQAPQFDTSAIDQRISALEGNAATQQPIGLDGVDGLSGKLSAYDSQLELLKSSLAEATSTNKALTERLTAAEEKLNEPRDDIEVARAIAAAALKAAIDRGGPFLTELDTLVQVTPEDTQLKALQPFAATGVPSRSEILKGFPTEANHILAELNQPDPNLGIMDRLTQSAMSLVRVRPVGNVAGDTPEAIIARIEDKLRNGDLKGAALEWDALPAEAKATGDAFKKSLDARVQVEDLVGSAVTRALTKNAEQG